jgi:hypothetical protein
MRKGNTMQLRKSLRQVFILAALDTQLLQMKTTSTVSTPGEKMSAYAKVIKLFTVMIATLLLFGCASTQKMTDADRAKFKTVKINNKVQTGQLFLLAPGGANIGLMFGAIGGALASGSIEDSQKAFAGFLERNSIFIDKIVREEVELALRESGKATIAGSGEASAPALNVYVPQYGFGVTNLLGSSVVPVLSIKCEIVDGAGQVIWNSNDRMGPSIANPMESMTWAQMHDDPKQIEEQLRKAAKYLAKKIIAEL